MKRNILTLALSVLVFSVSLFNVLAAPSDWAKDEIEKAKSENLLTDNRYENRYQSNMNRVEFVELAVNLYESINNRKIELELKDMNVFIDTKDQYALKAKKVGIINGVSENEFAPKDKLTREQFCTMIYRITENNENPNSIYSFSQQYEDEKDISNWAFESVKAMNHYKIMNGYNNYLYPKDNVSIEEAIALTVRCNDKFNTSTQNNTKDTVNTGEGYIYINQKNINIGDIKNSVIEKFGQPNDTLQSLNRGEWYVYFNQDYSNHFQIEIVDGSVYSILSNSNNFEAFEGYKIGIISSDVNSDKVDEYNQKTKVTVQFLYDKNNSNKLDTIYITKGSTKMMTLDSKYIYSQEKQNFYLVNALRSRYNLSPLKYNDNVATVARNHSADMGINKYFNHVNLNGEDPGKRLINNNLIWKTYGENIAAGQSDNIAAYFGWVNSSGHRNNMLNAKCQEIGVGINYNINSPYRVYYTQLFYTSR